MGMGPAIMGELDTNVSLLFIAMLALALLTPTKYPGCDCEGVVRRRKPRFSKKRNNHRSREKRMFVRNLLRCSADVRATRRFASVTRTVYRAGECDNLTAASPPSSQAVTSPTWPVVTLFTKEGCSLCDDVIAVLATARQAGHDHTLEALDITDVGHERWYSLYQYDIPVLHVGRVPGNSVYWAKHRLTAEEAAAGLVEAAAAVKGARNGFVARTGEPRGGWPEK